MFMTKMFWRSWESTFFLSPSSLLVSCELFVSMRVIHQKQLKLSELYATLYHSLCRCLIPPLYTMFMTTTLCHNCPCCWMLQVVTLCCLMLLHPYARNVSHFTFYWFVQKMFETFFHNLQYVFLRFPMFPHVCLCLILLHPYARNVSHFPLYCFMQKV